MISRWRKRRILRRIQKIQKTLAILCAPERPLLEDGHEDELAEAVAFSLLLRDWVKSLRYLHISKLIGAH